MAAKKTKHHTPAQAAQRAVLAGYPLYPQGEVGKSTGLQRIQLRMSHPTRGLRTVGMGTCDAAEAVRLYRSMVPMLLAEGFDASAEPRERSAADALREQRVRAAALRGQRGTFAWFAFEAVNKYLPTLVGGKGKHCGKALSQHQRKRYGTLWREAAAAPEFAIPIAALDVAAFNRYLGPFKVANQPGAYRARRAALCKLCDVAITLGLMSENFAGRTTSVASNVRGRDLTGTEVAKLLDAAHGWIAHVAAVCYFTGGRPGAVATLDAADVRQLEHAEADGAFPAGTWEILVSPLDKGGLPVLVTMTPKANGYARLDSALRYLLDCRALISDQRSRRWKSDLGPELIVHCPAAGSRNYIGEGFRADTLGKLIAAYGAGLGLNNFQARDLRAAAQTQATIAAGGKVSDLLGHKSEAMKHRYNKRVQAVRVIDAVPGIAA